MKDIIFWWLIGMFVGIFLGFFICQVTAAEEYNYNMTKEEKKEFNLTNFCYEMDSNYTVGNMDIKGLADFCKLTYGDLDTNYGDKIK